MGMPSEVYAKVEGRKRRCQLWGQSEREQGGAAPCSSRHSHTASWLRGRGDQTPFQYCWLCGLRQITCPLGA